MIASFFGTKDDVIEFEDEEEDQSPLWMRIICCTCCFKKKITSLIHLRKKNVRGLGEIAAQAITTRDIRSEEQRRLESALKIQSIGRGYLGRKAASRKWKQVIGFVDEYWFEVIRKRQAEIDRRNMIRRVRAQVHTSVFEADTYLSNFILSFSSQNSM